MTKSIFRLFRELSAIFFWFYLIGKVAIFDFDNYIVNRFIPSLASILHYKLFIFASIISILWLSLGKKRFPQFVLFVLGYPLLIIIWKIPKLIFKNWSISIIFAPSIFDMATKFRAYFIMNTLVALSTIFILTSNNVILLSVSMLILLSFLVYHLCSSFRKSYRSTVFSKIQRVISKFKNEMSDTSFFQKLCSDAGKNNKTNNQEEQLEKQISTIYLFYCFAEFFREKIDHLLQSRKMDLYLIFTWFWTVFVTAIIYSLEYYSLYKILPNSFEISFEPTYFSFLGFSFDKIAPSTVSSISPSNFPAIALCYSEMICTVIFVILVFTILTAARERYKEDICKIVNETTEIAAIIHSKFDIIFNMALDDAERFLLTNQKVLVNGMRKLRGLPELSNSNMNEPVLMDKSIEADLKPSKANSTDAKKLRG